MCVCVRASVCVLVSLLAWILRSALRQSTLRKSESCIYVALTCTAYRFVSLLLPCQSCHKNVVAGQSRLWQATLPHFTAALATAAAVSSQKVWRNFCAISDALNMADPAGHMEPAPVESAAHRSRRPSSVVEPCSAGGARGTAVFAVYLPLPRLTRIV